MLSEPLVTVYIPTHNRSSLVVRAVESVLAQTYKSIELIVVDDGSVDDTFETLFKYIESGEINYIKNETPKGAPNARNCAIEAAKGCLITGLDDDDFFLPTRVQDMVSAYADDFSFISTGYLVSGEAGETKVFDSDCTFTLGDILKSNRIGNQVLVETAKVRSIGGFDESLPAWQDYDLWLRLLRAYGGSKRISSPTYVVDKTHAHERISQNMSKLQTAFGIFLEKHPEYDDECLSSALRISLYRYDLDAASYFDILDAMRRGCLKRGGGAIFAKLKRKWGGG